jgi:HEPN domain-containing protein
VLTSWASAPTLSPDPDQAREWLRDELSRAEYQESLLERFGRWFSDLLDALDRATGQIGLMNPALATILLVLLAGLLAFALSRLRRNVAVHEKRSTVFTGTRRRAEDHRRSANEALDNGRWDEAVVEAVRALAAGLAERGLVPEQADITVHELTERAAAIYPSLDERLRRAGVTFDETRYGDRPADEQRARETVALELETSRRTPDKATSPGPVQAVPR